MAHLRVRIRIRKTSNGPHLFTPREGAPMADKLGDQMINAISPDVNPGSVCFYCLTL